MSEIQISKTLLILKSNSHSTTAAEHFLRNREWLVFSTTNLKDFLTYIIQKKPSFVMISVDHPNKKVMIMPKVLVQSFPVCVFTFAENSSSISFRKLQDVVCAYKVNPPATGPAIERAVNKFLRDQEKKMREKNEKPSVDTNGKPLAATDANKMTMIQSEGGTTPTGNVTMEGGDWNNQSASLLSQLLDGDDISQADDGSGAWIPSDGANRGDTATAAGGSLASPLSHGSYSEQDYEDIDHAHKLGKTPQGFTPSRQKQPKKYEKEGKIITILGRNPGAGRESIILKGTKQALDETVHISDGHVKQEVQDASQVACIVVESDRFSGYLIAALGKNRKMDGQFVKTIQDKLYKFLKDNGEIVSEKENLNLKIKKIEFEDWAIEYAEFLKKSVHHGDEIAMAFFPVTQARTEVGDSASATMASVKLKEIEGDKQVEFNMYLYLPANKKYILYTPKGGKFYANQKGRLEEKGVNEVHMLKSEVNDLAKYKAQNYLNNLIDNYRQKKTTKAS